MKKKKLLAGLTLGAIMATTPFIAGCKSDIEFNQTDLDNALKNINEYLETQNNYSSEFAKNVLNDYLLKGIERNQNNSKFGYKVTNTVQNSLNDISSNYTVDYKIYRENNKIKELCHITGLDLVGFEGDTLKQNANNYREMTSEYKPIINEPGSTLISLGRLIIIQEQYLMKT